MCKNGVQPGLVQMTIWLKHIACSIRKAKNAHLEYVIIIPFPQHQWLLESVAMLRHTYIAFIAADTFCIPTKPQTVGLLTKQVQEN